MEHFFKPYGVVSTEYILPAAAIISCGGQLHDHVKTREEPCIRMAVKENGKSQEKTIFQFQEMTSKGEHVKNLLQAYKDLDFNQPCVLPANHILVIVRKALNERNRLHLWYQKLMTGPVSEVIDGYMTNQTKLAAILSALGHKIIDARRINERGVAFFFEDNAELRSFVLAYEKPWGEYILHEDHPLYHMRGALENRESLIVLLKRASLRVEVKQGGKRFFLPVNASRETLANMVQKLNQ